MKGTRREPARAIAFLVERTQAVLGEAPLLLGVWARYLRVARLAATPSQHPFLWSLPEILEGKPVKAIAWSIVFLGCVLALWAITWEEVQTGKNLDRVSIAAALLAFISLINVMQESHRKD